MGTIKANLPSVDEWKQESDISSAGTKGWNPLIKIPELLHKKVPDLRKFRLGFCSKDDLPLWKSIGWVHMQRQHFEADNFNQAIGLGMGIDDEAGVLKYRDNYLMMMPKDYHDKVRDKRNSIFEESYEKMGRSVGTYVDRDDPRGEVLRKEAEATGEYGLEEEQFVIEPKKKPGRPRKT